MTVIITWTCAGLHICHLTWTEIFNNSILLARKVLKPEEPPLDLPLIPVFLDLPVAVL